MRNYVKMRVMVWTGTGPVTANMGAWGADDEQLMEYVRFYEQSVRDVFPTISFSRNLPHDIYVLLDSAHLAIILNGANFSTARQSIDASALITGSGYLVSSTTLESPRKTWSHGH